MFMSYMTFICMEMKRCDFFVVAAAHEFVIMTAPGSVYDNSVVSVDTSISVENKQSLDGGHQYGEVIARLL